MEQRKFRLTILKAQSGERAALDYIFRSVQLPLFRFILQITGQRETAEDVLQDVFILLQR